MSGAILTIKLGALGDMIQALDAFHDIRAHHRGAHSVLLTTPPFAALAARMPWFDEVWTDGRPKASEIGALIGLIARLRGARFARVYDLQCNHRTDWYRRLLAGPRRPDWFGAVPGKRHNSDAMRAQIAAAGVAEARPTDLSWLDADIAALALPKRFAMLVPGCSPHRPDKRWPAESYAALGARLRARGLETVLVGTAADRDAIARIKSILPDARDLSGRTNLFQLAAAARRAETVIGNDTGPVFLSAAVGAPTLTLMSRSTNPEQSAPRGSRTAWLRRDDLAALPVDDVSAALLTR
ncbi:MAG: glycosyltransferase family 9 protein [Stellaceae bacterium]